MKNENLNIGPLGYCVIGFLTIATVVAFVRAILMTLRESTTEDWISVGIGVGVVFGVSIVSYWVGRGIVYLILSFIWD